MLTVGPNTRVFVAVEPVDMRGSFDALAGHVRRLDADPLDGLYALEDPGGALGLSGDGRLAHRRRGRAGVDKFRCWLLAVVEGDLPRSAPVIGVATFDLRHCHGLTRVAHYPDLSVDNNAAELALRRHATVCFASLFAGSEEGAHRWAAVLGVERRAQKHRLDGQADLTSLFELRGTHKARFGLSVAQLTPAADKASGCPGSLTADVPMAAGARLSGRTGWAPPGLGDRSRRGGLSQPVGDRSRQVVSTTAGSIALGKLRR